MVFERCCESPRFAKLNVMMEDGRSQVQCQNCGTFKGVVKLVVETRREETADEMRERLAEKIQATAKEMEDDCNC